MKIHIDTCSGRRGYIAGYVCLIVAEDGRDILVQTDFDYPGFASTFGWSVHNVQKCPTCGKVLPLLPLDDHNPSILPAFATCDGSDHEQDINFPVCDHDHTDGTVDCKACGVTAGEFIAAAGEFLSDNDGAETDDPGYFDEN